MMPRVACDEQPADIVEDGDVSSRVEGASAQVAALAAAG
jgi:hypothetical protein